MIEFRPCGVCASLVPADRGCEHWKPRRGKQVTGAESRERKRERDRINAQAARDRAKADVAAFQKTMQRWAS